MSAAISQYSVFLDVCRVKAGVSIVYFSLRVLLSAGMEQLCIDSAPASWFGWHSFVIVCTKSPKPVVGARCEGLRAMSVGCSAIVVRTPHHRLQQMCLADGCAHLSHSLHDGREIQSRDPEKTTSSRTLLVPSNRGIWSQIGGI